MVTNTGDVLEATVIHDHSPAGEQVNKFQFKIDAPAPVVDSIILSDIQTIIEAIYTILQTYISVRNVLREVGVFNRTQLFSVGTTDADTYTGGTSADAALPEGVAAYQYFKTNISRVTLFKYWPSAATNDINTGGTVAPAMQTALAAVGTYLLDDISIGTRTYEYGYLSPKTLGWIRPDTCVVPEAFGYQRRRRRGRGS